MFKLNGIEEANLEQAEVPGSLELGPLVWW